MLKSFMTSVLVLGMSASVPVCAMASGSSAPEGNNMQAAATCSITSSVLNGYVLDGSRNALPNTVEAGTLLKVYVKPAVEGFEAENITMRHGKNLDGSEFVDGERQWTERLIPTGQRVVIPAEEIDGDILFYGEFTESPDSEWTAIWSDEFDGDEMDTSKWSYHPRYKSTWNKRVAKTDAERAYVNKFRNGCYESYSIATPEEFTDEEQNIITGAIYTHNKFCLTGGRIECRLRTRGHKGNFPAFWMMPSKSPYGWPKDGEIDIWEQIDASFTTFHTVHTGWTYKSFGDVSKNSPAKSGSTSMDPALWHVYTLEWDADNYLKWYVDGKLVFTYENQHFSEGKYTEDITWPFGKDFYIILNQSVGDGSWAADGDPAFEYLTEFDYVRAYQRKDALNYYTKEDGRVTGVESIIADDTADCDGSPVYYTIQGIQVDSSDLIPGLYIEKCGMKTRKILVD